MENLILDSLEIHRFRTFHHLCVERLGRVNLITGKNNVGKSCLLEALRLYASRGSLLVMRELLEARDETGRWPTTGSGEKAARYLFYGRRRLAERPEPIQIGPANATDKTLLIDVIWFGEQIGRDGQRRLRLLSPGSRDATGVVLPGLAIKLGARLILNYPLEIDIPDISRFVRPENLEEISDVFISANGLGSGQISLLWDKIALTDLEQQVLVSLGMITSQIERINLVGSQKDDGKRIPMAKMVDITDPLPLRSLGEGMNRLFGITLALLNARDGFLLVDEVESGLHYSVQPDLWRLIFQTARQLNVQVFATTHSWDCIEGFQEAARASAPGEGMLIRLDARKDEIAATLFDDRKLSIATREDIEVR
jgi:hypothetical protein